MAETRDEVRLSELERYVLATLRDCALDLSVLVIDETSRVVFANRDSEVLFGHHHSELTEKFHLSDLLEIDRPPGETFAEQFEHVRNKGRWEGEGRGVKRHGEPFVCTITLVYTLLSDAGDRRGLLVLIKDDTRRRDEQLLLEESFALSNALNEQMEQMNQDLLEVKQQLERAVGAQRRELQAVAEMQQALLPARLPELAGYQFGAGYMPSSQASGDYYDFFAVGPSCLGLLVADVSGHGARAAVDMAITRVLVHSTVKDTLSPASALGRLNSLLSDFVPTESFVTMFYGVLDPVHQSLRFALAGHPPPMLWVPGKTMPEELKHEPGFPLHLIADAEYVEHEVQLPAGSVLFIYTDGLTEAFNSEREMYGVERLARLLGELPAAPPQTLVDRVREDVGAFTGAMSLEDDFTAVAVHIGDAG